MATEFALDVQDLLAASVCVRAGQRLAGERVVDDGGSGFPWTFRQDVLGGLFDRGRDLGIVRPDVEPAAMGASSSTSPEARSWRRRP